MDTERIIRLADEFLNFIRLSEKTVNRNFRAHFGTSSYVTVILWRMVKSQACSEVLPKHLLWAMFFLKNVERSSNTTLWKCDEKTFPKWTWHVLETNAKLLIVGVFIQLGFRYIFLYDVEM